MIKNIKFQISNFKYLSKNSRGFTLIELLTVIVIIGVLTGLLTVSYLSVRQRGRDAQRKSDLKQIQSALEFYRADNDTYPPTATFAACGGVFSSGTTTYMQKIPCDPLSAGPYSYSYLSATTYILNACLDNTSDKDGTATKDPSLPAGVSCTWYYTVKNP